MIAEIDRLIREYTAWLRDKTSLRQVGDWIEITTPYLDRHNDCLQIYVQRQNGTYVLTDDGYTISDLRLSGCDLETPKRRDLLRMTLNGFGVQREGDALTVRTSSEDFSLRKHNLVQAMLAVNDLFYLAAPTVSSLFLEDVQGWLQEADIRFIRNAKFAGKSGLDQLFDFVIPASRRMPERLLRAINNANRNTAQAVAFAWHDVREVRQTEARAYAVINDTEREPSSSVVDAIRNYDIHPILWSRREEYREELAA